MKLFPYNYYILYIFSILTIIALFLFFLKVITLLKKLKFILNPISNIDKNIKSINEKTSIINNRINTIVNNFKKFLPFFIFSYFFVKNYNSSSEKGIKKINNSINKVITKDILEHKQKEILKKIIK